MPIWLVPLRSYDIPRNIALLDTNVLIAMFDKNDGRHKDAVAAVDLGAYRWAVSHANIIEAWNFLVGRIKRPDFAYTMMTWLLTPGNVILVGDAIEDVEAAHRYSLAFKIDIVDAGLIDVADRLTRACGIVPSVHVATYDVADFLRMFGRPNLNFNVYDMRDLSSTTGE